METPVAFLLDGAVTVRRSKTVHRPRSKAKQIPLHLPRLAALGLNLALWALIIVGVRHFMR